MKYDFDQIIDRRGTHCYKYDRLDDFFGRHDLLPLWVADMDFAVAPEILDALRRRLQHPVLGYASPKPEYLGSIIDWLRRRHGLEARRDELAYVGGVVKGIGLAINHFSRPGDRIVIQRPVYHPFSDLIEGNDRVIANNPLLNTPEGYKMDLEGLQRVVDEQRPTMMILCNPHNPIGLQWDADTLREVARICHGAGMTVVSDEIHGDLQPRGAHIPFLSVSDDAREIGVMLGAPSKTFNIPALSSSWFLVPDKARREPFYRWLQVNELATPTEAATLATEAAYTYGEPWLDQCLEYIGRNIDWVMQYVADEMKGVKAIRPQASFLVWLDFSALGLSHDELNTLLTDVAHVAVNDGEMFGPEGHGCVRLNVGAPLSVIQGAMQRISKSLKFRV